MRKRLLILHVLGVGALFVLSVASQAKFAMVDVKKVPIDRLVANLEKPRDFALRRSAPDQTRSPYFSAFH